LPEEVYGEFYKEMQIYSQENEKKIDVEEETKKGYLEYLEEAVSKNFDIYVRKRQLYYHVFLISLTDLSQAKDLEN
jgi:hypothetical protein